MLTFFDLETQNLNFRSTTKTVLKNQKEIFVAKNWKLSVMQK